MNRIFNFSAGPCTLPLPALEEAQAEADNYRAEKAFFRFSLSYLFLHFGALLADAALRGLGWGIATNKPRLYADALLEKLDELGADRVPMVIMTLLRALGGQFARHRRISSANTAAFKRPQKTSKRVKVFNVCVI